MRLFTYIVKHDKGSAPNPYWGRCSLAICKPSIRRSAQLGDLIMGFASKSTLLGDYSGRLIYVMQVTEKITMQQYRAYCRKHCPGKIVNWRHQDRRRRYGDCIYSFKQDGSIVQHPSVHEEGHKEADLSGAFVLLSTKFSYWGAEAIHIPKSLRPIIPVTQGHRVNKNQAYVKPVLNWLSRNGYLSLGLQGKPINQQADIGDDTNCVQ